MKTTNTNAIDTAMTVSTNSAEKGNKAVLSAYADKLTKVDADNAIATGNNILAFFKVSNSAFNKVAKSASDTAYIADFISNNSVDNDNNKLNAYFIKNAENQLAIENSSAINVAVSLGFLQSQFDIAPFKRNDKQEYKSFSAFLAEMYPSTPKSTLFQYANAGKYIYLPVLLDEYPSEFKCLLNYNPATIRPLLKIVNSETSNMLIDELSTFFKDNKKLTYKLISDKCKELQGLKDVEERVDESVKEGKPIVQTSDEIDAEQSTMSTKFAFKAMFKGGYNADIDAADFIINDNDKDAFIALLDKASENAAIANAIIDAFKQSVKEAFIK